MMKFYILTIFPELIQDISKYSIIGRAIKNGLIQVEAVNIRDFSEDKHKKTDDYIFGGGSGMLMTPEPIYNAYNEVLKKLKTEHPRVILTSAAGKQFTQSVARELSKEEEVVIVCGHYEGVDERIVEKIITDELSIGDYVLTGGELPACVMMDSISRLVEGVLTNEESVVEESFSEDLLEYPQYTRPQEFLGMKVPEVLLSGNHKEIEVFRKEKALEKTKKNRPDLLKD